MDFAEIQVGVPVRRFLLALMAERSHAQHLITRRDTEQLLDFFSRRQLLPVAVADLVPARVVFAKGLRRPRAREAGTRRHAYAVRPRRRGARWTRYQISSSMWLAVVRNATCCVFGPSTVKAVGRSTAGGAPYAAVRFPHAGVVPGTHQSSCSPPSADR